MNAELNLIEDLNNILPMEIINEILSYRITNETAKILKTTKTAIIFKKFIKEVKVEVEEYLEEEDFENKKDKNFCYWVWGCVENSMIRRVFLEEPEWY